MDSLHKSDDKLLFSLISKGDEKAFAELYSRYATSLYQQACRLLKDADESQDAVQEVYLRIWERRELLHEVTNPRYYLFQMLRNAGLRQIIASKREAEYTNDLANYVLEHARPADEEVRSRQMQEAIDREIANLPERMREVFLLKRDEDLSHQEIADRLNISTSTAQTHMKKAIQKLWKRLSVFFMLLLLLIWWI